MEIIKSKNKKNVLVSVIVPTFNGEFFLNECLSSIKNQTARNYEVIVSDANSEDSTIKIAKKYADKIVSSKKRGVAYQQNNGIKVAEGDVLVFVHQDVALAPNYLECAIDAINRGYVMGKSISIANGNSIVLKKYSEIDNLIDNTASKFNFLTGMTHFFIKKDLLIKNKFRQELYWDLDMIKRIRKFGKICFLKNTYAKNLDFIYEDGRNLVLTRGKKISFWKIIAVRYILFGTLSLIGFKLKH